MKKESVKIDNYTMFSIHIKEGNNCHASIRLPMNNFKDAWALFQALMVSKTNITISMLAHEYIDKEKNSVSGGQVLLETTWMLRCVDGKFTREYDWFLMKDKLNFEPVWHLINKQAKGE